MKTIYFLLIFFFSFQVSSQINVSRQILIDSAYTIATNSKNTIDVRLSSYNFCCWKTAYIDFNQALKISSEYLYIAKNANKINESSKAYHFLGHSQMMLGLFEDANKTLLEGIDFSINNNNYRSISELYGDLGNLHFNKGNSDKALEYHTKSLECAIKNKITIEQARAKINIGEIYQSKGNYKLSIKTFQEALDLCITKNSFGGFKSSIYESLGNLNFIIKEYETAEKNYIKSVEFAKKFNNNNRLIHSLNKLGQLSLEKNNLHDAFNFCNEALKIAMSTKAYVLEAKVRSNLAKIFLKQNKPNDALTNINIAINKFKTIGVKDDLDKAYIIAAEIYEILNQKKQSKEYYEKAYKVALTTNNINALKKASIGLAMAYEENGDLNKAIEYYKKFNKYENQIRDENDLKKIIRLEVQENYKQKIYADSLNSINEIKYIQFEHNKKEEQSKLKSYLAYSGIIFLLIILFFAGYFYNKKRENSIILADKNKIINEALNDKEILLKEVHHRVKNNMQVVSSLLQLKSRNTENLIAKDALIDSQKRIDSMRLAHQKMYLNENYQQIEIVEYINEMVNLLLKPIQKSEDDFKVNGIELWLEIEQAQTFGFILHELITNSIKYAWNENQTKKVSISIFKHENEIHFDYSDNGKGLPNDYDISTTKSFGMKLIYSLSTRQLLGKTQLNNSNGFSINIKFDAK